MSGRWTSGRQGTASSAGMTWRDSGTGDSEFRESEQRPLTRLAPLATLSLGERVPEVRGRVRGLFGPFTEPAILNLPVLAGGAYSFFPRPGICFPFSRSFRTLR
jgi:hypothetical protein